MNRKQWMAASLICAAAASGLFLGGCGKQESAQQQQATLVSTIKPFISDTPIVYEYTGTVAALQEVPVRARVSGMVMEKYISGGETVTEGQPLYRLDTRNYESTLAAARASQAQAGALYQNALTDLGRYESLIGSGAISRQTYDSQKSMTEQYRQAYEAAAAQVRLAEDNLSDAVVTAPFSGKLSMDDVNVGTYANAGSTALVTISSTNPVYVQFDMSESEYLDMVKKNKRAENWDGLKLRLSDGSTYGETGKVVQVNPGLSSGQLTLKAAFNNPDGLLVTGMYGTIVSDNEIAKGSLLIPTQALVQLLDKNLVDVVVDNKVQQKPVEIAGTYGIYTVVTKGLSTDDVIIVEGQGKVRVGQEVQPQETTKDALEAAAQALKTGAKGDK